MYLKLDYTETFKASFYFIKNYNEKQKDADGKRNLKKEIRPAHKHVLEVLIRLFSTNVIKAGAISTDEITPIYTNNVKLANATLMSRRTIGNILNRLEKTQVITKEWRGTYADYVIHINPQILVYKGKIDVKNPPIKELNQAEKAEILTENTSENSNKAQSLPLILEYLKNISNLITDKVKTSQFWSNEERQAFFSLKNNTEKANKQVEISDENKISDEKKFIIAILYDYAISRVFHKLRFISHFERLHIKKYFYNELKNLEKKPLNLKFEELMLRMHLINRWITKTPTDKKQVQNRFVPIPSLYFSEKVTFNFNNTKKWLAEKINSRIWQATAVEETKAQIRQWYLYQNTVQPTADVMSYDTSEFKNVAEKLSAENGSLADAFYKQILNN